MRVSTPYQFETYAAQVRQAYDKYASAQERLATGKRISKLTDDPSGAAYVMSLASLKSGMQQYEANLTRAKDTLGNTELALESSNSFLQSAYQLALKGANDSISQEARDAMVGEISALQSRLVEAANSKNGAGQYIFAGQITDSKPFAVSGGALVYSGDNQNLLIEVSPGRTLTVNSQGGQLFQDVYAALEALKNDLASGDAKVISDTDLPALKARMNDLLQARGTVGNRLREVEGLSAEHTRRIDDLTARISDTEDVDISEAMLQYSLAQTAYQAALQSVSRGFGLSLMDFIQA